MLQIDHINFRYGRRKAPVFTDFNITLPSDSICGLLGKNGTGKSTLLYIMCGLLFPQGGRVTFCGHDVGLRRPEVLQELFLVPEEFEMPEMKMSEYVRYNAPFYPNFSREVLSDCLADFGLPADVRLNELSMGQKKQAFISFALAANTRLLLMDEPTNGLDIPAKSQFRKVLSRHMAPGRTIVISTHQVRDIDILLDHVAVIDGSRLLANHSTAAICRHLAFEERPIGADVSDALYVQPSIQGNSVICRNTDGHDTPLNLELLFNALQACPQLLDGVR